MNRGFDLEALRAQRWFHTIDLPDGTCTPGVFDTRASAARLDWPAVRGARCLDIGTCDGFWAFEMERRGAAEVVAIDIDDPAQLDLPRVGREDAIEALRKSFAKRKDRFELAAAALSSRVRRIPSSVFDLDAAMHGTFDVVFCGSLLIHVREPIRALECMARVCSGEILILEGVDARLDLLRRATPCARLEPASMQWWRANTAGLLAMLRLAGYDVVSTGRHFHTPNGAGLYFPHLPSGPLSRANYWVRTRLAATKAPLVTSALGLVFGTYDVAVRARPRAPITSSRA